MPAENSLTSTTWNPWDGSSYAQGTTDRIEFDYSLLGFTPSSSDSYKSTSGDIFKVYIDGVRIYRTHDATYASGTGFLEDGDTATTLNGASATWSNTSDTVWEIDTTAQVIRVDKSNVWATTLYADDGLHASVSGNSDITFNNTTIIELRRSAQNESSPSVNFSNASILTEQDLDNSSLNVFHMAQQAIVNAEKGIVFDTGSDTWDAKQGAVDKKIRGVLAPVADNDAVNRGFLSPNLDNINTVAGISGNVTTVATAPIPANMATIVGLGTNGSQVTTVAGKDAEIGRIGTAPMAASIALIGTLAMANSTDGDIKLVSEIVANVTKVADIDDKVTAVANLGTNGVDVTTVSNIGTDGAHVTTVAGKDTEIGRIGTAEMAASIALIGTAPMANSSDGDIKVVADNNANVTKVADIDDEVEDVAAIDTEITTLINGTDGTSGTGGSVKNILLVNSVHGKITEVGNLGTSTVVGHMTALNGTNVISHMAALNGTNVITHIAALNASNVITHIAALNAANVITHIAALNASNVITNIAALNASGVIADIGDVADVDTEIGRLGTAPMAASIALIGTADMANSTDGDIKLVSEITANVTKVADIDGDVTKVADIDGNVTKVANIDGNVTTVAGIGTNGADVTTVAGKSTEIGLLGTSAMAHPTTGYLVKVGTNVAELTRYGTEYTISGSSPGSPQNGWLWSDTGNNILKHYNGGTSSWDQVSSTGISNVADDSTPQLGGDLDLNSNDITGTGGIPAGNLTGTIADGRMPDLTGEVTTSAGAVAVTITDNIVDEANLKISNAGSNGQFLSKQSGDTGGLTWATPADPDTGISNTNHLVANANVADNDFLRVDGTSIEGRTDAETRVHLSIDNVTNASQATIQAATLTAATKSDVGLSAVDNSSDNTIRAGNITGTVNSVAVATISSGAALGTSSNQDSTSSIQAGTTKANVGLGSVANESRATILASPTLTGAAIFTGGIVEKVGTASNSGTTVTVDLATGNFFQIDMASNSGNIVTFTINNINGTSNQLSSFILKIENSASNRLFTWASIVSNGTNIDWAGGSGPDITAGDGKIDILSFTTYNNGSTWYGAIVGQDFG